MAMKAGVSVYTPMSIVVMVTAPLCIPAVHVHALRSAETLQIPVIAPLMDDVTRLSPAADHAHLRLSVDLLLRRNNRVADQGAELVVAVMSLRWPNA